MTPTDDTLVVFGGACKALDNAGKIGGYLVLFGSADSTDASEMRDYFTAETDFGFDVATKSRLLYHHGLNPEVGKKKLGKAPGNLKVDEVGVWVDGQLNLRDDYEKAIWGMVKAGKIGFSSGTAPHLIGRQKQSNGSHKITEWPLGLDASLTPTPAEPRTRAMALKTLALEASAAKGLLLGDMAEPSAAMAAVGSLSDRLNNALWRSIGDEKKTAPERLAEIAGAMDEFKGTALRILTPLLMGPDADAAALAIPDGVDAAAMKSAEADLYADLMLLEL